MIILNKNREEIINKVYELAFKYEAERGSCPQCVYAALMETLGIGNEEVVKAGDGLAGGTALSTQGTCGALVGGILAIGSLVGRSYKDFSSGSKRRRIFQYTKKLYDRFIEEYGSILCKDIHMKLFGRTFNLLDPNDYRIFEEMGGHVDKCTKVSANAAKWTAEIILDLLE